MAPPQVRNWQCGTLQVDMNLPGRFELNYVDEFGQKQVPVMLHRALFGSLERFTGILIEHYAGKLPAWLSPVQISVLAISEKSYEYVQRIHLAFRRAGLRVQVDCGREKIGHKIRQHTLNKVPYMAIVGVKEIENLTVNLRHVSGESLGEFALADAVSYLVKQTTPPDIQELAKKPALERDMMNAAYL